MTAAVQRAQTRGRAFGSIPRRRARWAWVTVVAVVLGLLPRTAMAQTPDESDDVARILSSMEEALASGDRQRYLDLIDPAVDPREAATFAEEWLGSAVDRAVVRERLRQPLPEPGTDLGAPADPSSARRIGVSADIFTESGTTGRLSTWRIELRHDAAPGQGPPRWRITAQHEVSAIPGLYRLRLTPRRSFVASDLLIRSEDLELRFPSAAVYVADVPGGSTALVVIGEGHMLFSPPSAAEQRQLEIFSSRARLDARVQHAFVRLNPGDFSRRVSGVLQPFEPSPADFRAAVQIFEDELSSSFGFDLADLSADRWSLVPSRGDLLATVRTREYDTLTYARLAARPEDISLIDRQTRRLISLYSSAEVLARRGVQYNYDDLIDYDILDYDIEARFAPDREWMEGRTRLRLRVTSPSLSSLNVSLARSLTLRAALSEQFGHVLAVRGDDHNVFVQLPEDVSQGTILDLTFDYSGRLESQTPVREALRAGPRPQQVVPDPFLGVQEEFPAEPSWLFSSNSYWYVQSTVTDYGTARLRLGVPERYTAVATGALPRPPELESSPDDRGTRWRWYTFYAGQPVRYLAWLISRFSPGGSATVTVGPERDGPTLGVTIEAVPRQMREAEQVLTTATDILSFYASLIGEFPYPSLRIALIETDVAGGHSPAYMVQLHRAPPLQPHRLRGDPVYFERYPSFFLAHELAHQWWGQGVGWMNFHEQWLSEGLAQYFAVLYSERIDPGDFPGVERQLRRSSLEYSDQGPISLGYRLGLIQGDSRIFRALLYNKAAATLQMLRRLIGDEAFIGGLRRFWRTHRFTKAGTEDFRTAMEAEAGRSLERFFDTWIYGQDIPHIAVSWHENSADRTVRVRFEQTDAGPAVAELPVTVTLLFEDGVQTEHLVDLADHETEVRLPLTHPLRRVEVNRDAVALAEFTTP